MRGLWALFWAISISNQACRELAVRMSGSVLFFSRLLCHIYRPEIHSSTCQRADRQICVCRHASGCRSGAMSLVLRAFVLLCTPISGMNDVYGDPHPGDLKLTITTLLSRHTALHLNPGAPAAAPLPPCPCPPLTRLVD